jgi:hypothetical protein
MHLDKPRIAAFLVFRIPTSCNLHATETLRKHGRCLPAMWGGLCGCYVFEQKLSVFKSTSCISVCSKRLKITAACINDLARRTLRRRRQTAWHQLEDLCWTARLTTFNLRHLKPTENTAMRRLSTPCAQNCHRGIGTGGFGAVGGSVKLSGDALEKAIHPTAQTTSATRKATIHRKGRLDLRRLVS